MKEYVVLISEYSNEVKVTLQNIVSGKIKEFNYKSKNQMNSTGGALAKSTSKPKDLHKEENEKFVAGLNKNELKLKDIYEKIRANHDEKMLVQLVKDKAIKPGDRNGLGQCPLLFASDCSFNLETCKSLVELGCDINSKDSNGDTLLHQAVCLENTELEKWLVDEMGVSTDVKNNDGETAYD